MANQDDFKEGNAAPGAASFTPLSLDLGVPLMEDPELQPFILDDSKTPAVRPRPAPVTETEPTGPELPSIMDRPRPIARRAPEPSRQAAPAKARDIPVAPVAAVPVVAPPARSSGRFSRFLGKFTSRVTTLVRGGTSDKGEKNQPRGSALKRPASAVDKTDKEIEKLFKKVSDPKGRRATRLSNTVVEILAEQQRLIDEARLNLTTNKVLPDLPPAHSHGDDFRGGATTPDMFPRQEGNDWREFPAQPGGVPRIAEPVGIVSARHSIAGSISTEFSDTSLPMSGYGAPIDWSPSKSADLAPIQPEPTLAFRAARRLHELDRIGQSSATLSRRASFSSVAAIPSDAFPAHEEGSRPEFASGISSVPVSIEERAAALRLRLRALVDERREAAALHLNRHIDSAGAAEPEWSAGDGRALSEIGEEPVRSTSGSSMGEHYPLSRAVSVMSNSSRLSSGTTFSDISAVSAHAMPDSANPAPTRPATPEQDKETRMRPPLHELYDSRPQPRGRC